ncbi:hypothetical protein PZA11_004639 [Diplocarpon coronariae]
MRSVYFTIALIYSLAAGAAAQCSRYTGACNSQSECETAAAAFQCPQGLQKGTNSCIIKSTGWDCGCCVA